VPDSLSLNASELAEIRQAAHIAGYIPEIEVEIHSMQKTLTTKAFEMLAKGKLTPDEALNLWMEMYAYHRVGQRFREKAKLVNQYTETKRR
jgi:hypothetical protein